MGLNYVKRGKRERLDPPNDFITVGLAQKYGMLAHIDEELNIDFENRQLDIAEKAIRELDFTD